MQTAKSPAALKASVGVEPCLQCTSFMRDFCGKKKLKCDAWEHYEETGETPQRSAIGWVVD